MYTLPMERSWDTPTALCVMSTITGRDVPCSAAPGTTPSATSPVEIAAMCCAARAGEDSTVQKVGSLHHVQIHLHADSNQCKSKFYYYRLMLDQYIFNEKECHKGKTTLLLSVPRD